MNLGLSVRGFWGLGLNRGDSLASKGLKETVKFGAQGFGCMDLRSRLEGSGLRA